MQIGVAGIGAMGAAVAARLMEVGHQVTVWNRSTDKTKPLTAAGAKVAASPAALCTRRNPASRAAMAVCGPTAKITAWRLGVRRTRARTPLALVTSTAWIPARSGGAPSRNFTLRSGASSV